MPTPACCVISSTETSAPCFAKSARALAMRRSRFRRASLRNVSVVATYALCHKNGVCAPFGAHAPLQSDRVTCEDPASRAPHQRHRRNLGKPGAQSLSTGPSPAPSNRPSSTRTSSSPAPPGDFESRARGWRQKRRDDPRARIPPRTRGPLWIDPQPPRRLPRLGLLSAPGAQSGRAGLRRRAGRNTLIAP